MGADAEMDQDWSELADGTASHYTLRLSRGSELQSGGRTYGSVFGLSMRPLGRSAEEHDELRTLVHGSFAMAALRELVFMQLLEGKGEHAVREWLRDLTSNAHMKPGEIHWGLEFRHSKAATLRVGATSEGNAMQLARLSILWARTAQRELGDDALLSRTSAYAVAHVKGLKLESLRLFLKDHDVEAFEIAPGIFSRQQLLRRASAFWMQQGDDYVCHASPQLHAATFVFAEAGIREHEHADERRARAIVKSDGQTEVVNASPGALVEGAKSLPRRLLRCNLWGDWPFEDIKKILTSQLPREEAVDQLAKLISGLQACHTRPEATPTSIVPPLHVDINAILNGNCASIDLTRQFADDVGGDGTVLRHSASSYTLLDRAHQIAKQSRPMLDILAWEAAVALQATLPVAGKEPLLRDLGHLLVACRPVCEAYCSASSGTVVLDSSLFAFSRGINLLAMAQKTWRCFRPADESLLYVGSKPRSIMEAQIGRQDEMVGDLIRLLQQKELLPISDAAIGKILPRPQPLSEIRQSLIKHSGMTQMEKEGVRTFSGGLDHEEELAEET
ncbi:hypothetical protein BDZ90DRAFT_263244 [Jaminaea rosea]|uniref:Uncharacterized protein n=1 Tax=Jaminaea rosea TaxID=1569628 RepID=A0A316UGL4_9BASI|nr:hypothetical protein BDZ90DRAFT_263244 [Jaminaea rosea]PWN24396.1 hypothetical protein BDZ90DRAFT_263244 [Jaminaea rosea]